MLNAGKDVEQQERLFIASGSANGTATLEDCLAVSYKTNIHRMIQQSYSLVFTQIC